jgi:hypothetical protein
MNDIDLGKLGITKSQLDEVLIVWVDWNSENQGEFEGTWKTYGTLRDETGVDIKSLKKLFKVLREKKIAYAAPCVNHDYIPNGSGNFLNGSLTGKSWEEIKELLVC